MEIDGDILEILKDVPEAMADQTVTTEFKFMTLGAILVRCSDEIIYLRKRVKELEDDQKSKTKSKVR